MAGPRLVLQLGAASEAHLRERLAIVEARVRDAVERRRASDPNPDDRFRGLYISDRDIDGLVSASTAQSTAQATVDRYAERGAQVEAWAEALEGQGAALRLLQLARAFGLQPIDVELLLIAVAPDLDPRFERFYG